MSRIGKKPIDLTLVKGVEVKLDKNLISLKGPKGTLKRTLHESMIVENKDNQLIVTPKDPNNKEHRKFHGLTRSLVSNMVIGVHSGFTKSLTLVGVGYRAAVQGKDLQLTLGFSHPIVYKIPEGLQITVDKQTQITVTGADKELVGQSAADIRSFRKPEPYHGKGVRYSDEVIITKVGKTAGKK